MGITDSLKKIDTIITIDPITLKSYKFKNNEIIPNRLKGFDKKHFYVSVISSKNLIMESIEINSNISDEDLKNAIDIQVYDELNLDIATEYKIFYKEITDLVNSENRRFNIFAIEAQKLKDEFKDAIDKVKYIDYITPEPFTIRSLYKRDILNSDSRDCFLYFKENDAFLAIYNGGNYVYSKSINFSLKKIYEKFCEFLGENYPYQEFVNFLTTGSLKNEIKDGQRLLIKLYKEIFIYVNDIIFYVKRAYQIDTIDRIFINSDIGVFKNIDRYIRTYLDIEPHELNFVIAKNSKQIRSNQLHNLMILSALDYLEERDDSLNFSIFKRPPPLFKRASGKILLVVLLSLLISLAYPIYQFSYALFLNFQTKILEKKEQKLYIKAMKIKNRLEKLNSREREIKSRLSIENKKLLFREKLLKQISNKKLYYPMKIELLSDIFKKINIFRVKIYGFKVDKNKSSKVEIHLYVYSKNEKNITEFIKSLTAAKEYEISTKEIKRDKKKSVYLSDIKVVLNAKNQTI